MIRGIANRLGLSWGLSDRWALEAKEALGTYEDVMCSIHMQKLHVQYKRVIRNRIFSILANFSENLNALSCSADRNNALIFFH